MKLLLTATFAIIGFLVGLAGFIGLTWNTPGNPPNQPKGSWTRSPDDIYPDKWLFVSPSQEVLGTVEKPKFDNIWSAFNGGAYCGKGEFMTEDAAKTCVDGIRRTTGPQAAKDPKEGRQ
jgi:hypothetical protein